MSGLARLLAGHTEPGLYHWAAATGVEHARHAAEHAGWRFVALDTWQVEDKDGFLKACGEAFGLTDGTTDGTLTHVDQLADALSEVRAGDGVGVVVLWDGWSPLARAQPQVFDAVLSVLADRADDERSGAFAVLLRGPGPVGHDLPELDPHAH